ncbi:hypothetical protein [Labedella endophytica]|uniref:Uncharacterized protein n=1 Tax=Labedella endophytica TaxID=1523160 RepID=A0A3S1CRX2_9MICO|nr:hypothetical protein [Labedella endophytica]RUR00864.1 hypothetical protein ELQ94_04780 [Labedella endophytica]
MTETADAQQGFDIRAFTRSAVGSHSDALPLDAFAERPLTPDTVRTLAYLRDVERATMHHMRDVLVTPSHKDARLTAFLATWAFEKYWIADAFDRIVGAQADSVHAERGLVGRALHRIDETRDRLAPIGTAIAANLIGEDVIATHVTRGAIDEYWTREVYSALSDAEARPELTELLATFAHVRSRHRVFFEEEALRRLAETDGARRLTRAMLSRRFLPTGMREEPSAETRYVFRSLFPDARSRGRIARIDRRIDALPGMGGLRVMQRAAQRFGAAA